VLIPLDRPLLAAQVMGQGFVIARASAAVVDVVSVDVVSVDVVSVYEPIVLGVPQQGRRISRVAEGVVRRAELPVLLLRLVSPAFTKPLSGSDHGAMARHWSSRMKSAR
jgi:hypothetical protein